MSHFKPKACIVMPTLNEGSNIKDLIPKIFNYQPQISSHELHILIVDGDSHDDTQAIIKDLQLLYPTLHMIHCSKRGLGVAYKAGFKHAFKHIDPELIFEMDADGQHDPKMIPLFISLIDYGFDCVIGSRFVSGGQLINFSLRRRFISKLGNFLIRVIGGIPTIADCTSGYRCIKSSYIKKCSFKYLLTSGYAFQSSLISELVRHQTRIVEFPIIFNERTHGESKLRLIDQIDFLINLFYIRVNRSFLFLKYGIIGASGIVVNLGFYVILTRLLTIMYTPAMIIAFEISVFTNFLGHQLWTFKHPDIMKKNFMLRFFHYHLSVLLSLIIQISVFHFCLRFLFIMDILANFIGICCGFIINYIINTQITWRNKQ